MVDMTCVLHVHDMCVARGRDDVCVAHGRDDVCVNDAGHGHGRHHVGGGSLPQQRGARCWRPLAR